MKSEFNIACVRALSLTIKAVFKLDLTRRKFRQPMSFSLPEHNDPPMKVCYSCIQIAVTLFVLSTILIDLYINLRNYFPELTYLSSLLE